MRRGPFYATLMAMVLCGTSGASILTYVEQATGSGQLGSTPFTLQPITLTLTGNTDAIMQPSPGLFVEIGTVGLFVAGVGSATFTDTVQVVSNQMAQDAGFGDKTNGLGILFTRNGVFASYDLKSPIGPVTGTAVFNSGTSFNTTAGVFQINSITGSSSFTAVPEPNEQLPVALLVMSVVVIAGRKYLRLVPPEARHHNRPAYAGLLGP